MALALFAVLVLRRYVDLIGADKFVDRMNGFADKYGPQFKPVQLAVDMAKSGKTFH